MGLDRREREREFDENYPLSGGPFPPFGEGTGDGIGEDGDTGTYTGMKEREFFISVYLFIGEMHIFISFLLLFFDKNAYIHFVCTKNCKYLCQLASLSVFNPIKIH